MKYFVTLNELESLAISLRGLVLGNIIFIAALVPILFFSYADEKKCFLKFKVDYGDN